MNAALSLLILTELVLFFLWVSFAKKDKKKSKDLISGMMFLVALVILYQVFKLNLDFGLFYPLQLYLQQFLGCLEK